jgi:peroxiredoxin
MNLAMRKGFRSFYDECGRIFRLTGPALVGCLIVVGPVGAKEKLQVGDIPPDNLGRTASGDHVKLSDYHGKIVIVSFWASWCAPCRQELPVLAGIQKRVSRDRLVVFAVNWKESREQYRLITKSLKDVDLTLISDEGGSFGARYGVNAIPHMFIIGRDGRIAAVHVGYGEGEIPDLVKEINALLAAPSSL